MTSYIFIISKPCKHTLTRLITTRNPLYVANLWRSAGYHVEWSKATEYLRAN